MALALLSDDDRATASTVYGKIWTCGFRDMRAGRQTEKQTKKYTNAKCMQKI